MVDVGLHFLGQNLLPYRVLEFRLPLGHGFSVFRFKRLERAEHLQVVGQAAVDFPHHLGVGHLKAVESGVVEEELFEEDGLDQAAFVVGGHLTSFELGLGDPVADVAGQHDFVAHHGHDTIDALVGVGGRLGPNVRQA